MIGSPVIIEHQDVTDKNADKIRCGVISDAYFNEPDGWYYAEGIIWDDKAISLINDGWSVSCSYDFLAFNDEGGEENNIRYDKEFTELNFTHLAIVNNPRYERANIVFNSKIEEKNGYKNTQIDNLKEQDMTLLNELKKLITKVENNKENEEMIDNEKVDKRKLIDEVGGILKGKVDDEIIRTIIKKMEEASYNDSEASADNKKVKNEDDEEKKIDNEEKEEKVDNEEEKKDDKVDNEEEEDEEKVEELKKEEKKDVENKCKNSKETSTFDKINAIYNSVRALKPKSTYTSRQEKLDNAVEYFKN